MDYSLFYKAFTLTIRALLLFIIVFMAGNIACAQPVNDNCLNGIDISNGNWFTGTNQNSTLSCTDHRTSNCTTPQQTTNMCCGTSGVEGTVWYKFTLTNTDTVWVDFRNAFPCNPASLLGPTTIQGFVLRRAGGCGNPNADTVKACFNPSTTADFTVPKFYALAGVAYMVQVDTKKNTLSTCTCDDPASATCHAYCPFEIRIRPKNAFLKFKNFNLAEVNKTVRISWYYDYEENYSDFRIKRQKLSDNTVEVIAEGPVNKFNLHAFNFQFDDYTVEENGLYIYYLEGSYGGTIFEPVLNKTIFVGYVDEIDAYLIPNPAKDDLKISLINVKNGTARYEIYSTLGIMVLSGYIDKQMQYCLINTCLIPRGMYFVKVVIGNTVLSRKLLLN
jgi:hypothetical protein